MYIITKRVILDLDETELESLMRICYKVIDSVDKSRKKETDTVDYIFAKTIVGKFETVYN